MYCSKELQIQVKNSLEDNYDSLSYQHELRKFGEKVEQKSDPHSQVFIKKIKSEAKVFYYGVQNDSEDPVEARLEFKQQKSLVSMNKEFSISKKIPPKGIKFYICLKEREDKEPTVELTWSPINK